MLLMHGGFGRNAYSAVPTFFPQSRVDVSFWSELGSRKLDEFKLSETPIDVRGMR